MSFTKRKTALITYSKFQHLSFRHTKLKRNRSVLLEDDVFREVQSNDNSLTKSYEKIIQSCSINFSRAMGNQLDREKLGVAQTMANQQNTSDSCWETIAATPSFSKTRNYKCERIAPPPKIHKGTPLPKQSSHATYKCNGHQRRWSQNRKAKSAATDVTATKNLKILHEETENPALDQDFDENKNSTIVQGGVSICQPHIFGLSPIKGNAPKTKEKVVAPLKHYLVNTLKSPDSSQSKVEKWLASTEKHFRKKDFSHIVAQPIPFSADVSPTNHNLRTRKKINNISQGENKVCQNDELSNSDIDEIVDNNNNNDDKRLDGASHVEDCVGENKNTRTDQIDKQEDEFSPIPSEFNEVYQEENSLESCIMSEIVEIRKANKTKAKTESHCKDKKKSRRKRKRIAMKISPKKAKRNTAKKKNKPTGKRLPLPTVPCKPGNVTLRNGSLCFLKKGYNLRSCPVSDDEICAYVCNTKLTNQKETLEVNEEKNLKITATAATVENENTDASKKDCTDETPPEIRSNIESGRRKLSFLPRRKLSTTEDVISNEVDACVPDLTCCLFGEETDLKLPFTPQRTSVKCLSESSYPSDCLSF